MIRIFLWCWLAVFPGLALAALSYQEPVSEIRSLVDAQLAPVVRMDSDGERILLLYRDTYKTIAELSEPELRLGGLRINPVTNIGSRTRYYNNVAVKELAGKSREVTPASESGEAAEVKGLPSSPRLAYFAWSPDEQFVSFTHTTESGVEVWLLDVNKTKARRLTKAKVNANLGNPITWAADSQSMLVNMLPKDRRPLVEANTAVPAGPTTSDSAGAKAQNRTYQDLLKGPVDEQNFEQLARSEIYRVSLRGKARRWLPAAMYRDISFSPDGNYVLVNMIKRPFSYLVPFYRFASETNILTAAGKMVTQLRDMPVEEVRPKGFMATTKENRWFSWRSDHPATITWVKALDEGDPALEVSHRDEVFQLPAPFDGEPDSVIKTINRFAEIYWGNSEVAIAVDSWFDNRNTKTYSFNPSADQAPVVLFDRNYQDRYSDPGEFVMDRNKLNQEVLALENDKAFLFGDGFSDRGQFPFVDEINLLSGQQQRLYESGYEDRLERLIDGIDMASGKILVRIESPTDYPNYFIRNIASSDLKPVTTFDNPFKGLENVHKEVISYQRDDGLPLTGTLYLPAAYNPDAGEKLPMLMWAYPVEYKDKSSAGQKTSNANGFIYPSYGSPIFWVTRGYAVLDAAAFPIVGEGDEQPNDSFRKQLVANGKAAIDAVDALGYIDRNRVGVGGHSYGAFMVANLLSHSDLFAAGIARSGAYNRTLTPFGFQREERNYWEAPEVYYTMSPFMHAEKMKTPLLLIHGAADNNSGTYPMQSERYFNALKGLGAHARLVVLPKESHGYRARESILHMLWEQDQWLEKYVKQKSE